MIQVLMEGGFEDSFRRWLDEKGLYLYKIPNLEDPLATYGIGIGKLSTEKL